MARSEPRTDGVQLNANLSSLGGVRALVFDLDGTLVDSSPGIRASLEVAFRAAGRELPSYDLRAVIGPPIGIIARNIEPALTDDEVVAIEREYRADYDTRGWRETYAFDGVVESLRRLRGAGLRLFVVTNKPRVPTEKIVAHLEISVVFEALLTRDSVTPRYASKAAMLADLMRSHGLNAVSSAMVGDTHEDQEAARANGVRFVYATYGYGSLQRTDLLVNRFSAIEDMLTRRVAAE